MRKSSFLLNIPLPKFTLFFCEMHPSLNICEMHPSFNICEMHPSLNICEMHPVTQHLWNTFLTQHLWNAPLTQHLRNAPPSLNICEAHICRLKWKTEAAYQAVVWVPGPWALLYIIRTMYPQTGSRAVVRSTSGGTLVCSDFYTFKTRLIQ